MSSTPKLNRFLQVAKNNKHIPSLCISMLHNLDKDEILSLYEEFIRDDRLDMSLEVFIELHLKNLDFDYGSPENDSRSP